MLVAAAVSAHRHTVRVAWAAVPLDHQPGLQAPQRIPVAVAVAVMTVAAARVAQGLSS
jgi:hypothetical protein